MSREYEAALTDHTYFDSTEWNLSNRLKTEHVWDSFVIYSLLEDYQSQGLFLEVLHTGEQANRFKDAMKQRNQRIVFFGQPDAVRHVCDKCMRVFKHEDGSFCKCFLVLLICYNH